MKAKFKKDFSHKAIWFPIVLFSVFLLLDFTQICILWRITRLFAFYDSGLFETL